VEVRLFSNVLENGNFCNISPSSPQFHDYSVSTLSSLSGGGKVEFATSRHFLEEFLRQRGTICKANSGRLSWNLLKIINCGSWVFQLTLIFTSELL